MTIWDDMQKKYTKRFARNAVISISTLLLGTLPLYRIRGPETLPKPALVAEVERLQTRISITHDITYDIDHDATTSYDDPRSLDNRVRTITGTPEYKEQYARFKAECQRQAEKNRNIVSLFIGIGAISLTYFAYATIKTRAQMEAEIYLVDKNALLYSREF